MLGGGGGGLSDITRKMAEARGGRGCLEEGGRGVRWTLIGGCADLTCDGADPYQKYYICH
jgi:hypothetical protein